MIVPIIAVCIKTGAKNIWSIKYITFICLFSYYLLLQKVIVRNSK